MPNLFAPLADKLALAKSWPGIDPEDVDNALAEASQSGTLAGYEAESPHTPLLDIVVTAYRESVPATLLYARDRMREVHGDLYHQQDSAYGVGVNERRVRLLEGTKPFVPNRIVIEVVDLGANRGEDLSSRDVHMAPVEQLAGFAVLYAASQSPKWVRRMDGEKVPYVFAAAILLDVTADGKSYACMPRLWRIGAHAELAVGCVDQRHFGSALPVLREFRR